MSYTDEVVKAKLSALNETQESIVTVAQWIMFHRRYADRTAALWVQKLKDSSASKRLNLVYLANEVVQQSKARKKDDFLIAFSPIMAEATASAYKGATNEVQQKLKRVVEVWRQRMIFEIPIQEAVEARLAELDKSRGAGRKPLMGGSALSSSSGTSAPTELQPLVPLQQASTAAISKSSGSQDATVDYDNLMDPASEPPSAPVHAARLSALLKKLASAEGAVAESIKARSELIVGLEKLLGTNREALEREESRHKELSVKKEAVDTKKREVEDEILRKLPLSESATRVGTNGDGAEGMKNGLRDVSVEPERPQMEALTPPDATESPVDPEDEFEPAEPGEESVGAFDPGTPTPPADFDFVAPEDPSSQDNDGPSSKKRKLEDGGFGGFVSDSGRGLEDDVDDLIKAEGGGF